MATNPNSTHVFTAVNFNSLNTKKNAGKESVLTFEIYFFTFINAYHTYIEKGAEYFFIL